VAIFQSRRCVRRLHGLTIPWRRRDEFCLQGWGLCANKALRIFGTVPDSASAEYDRRDHNTLSDRNRDSAEQVR
jgi:hypothetical protein